MITLIGNKCDLEHLRVVQKEQAKAFASEHQLAFLETSALDSRNVEEAFTWLVNEVYKVVTSNEGIAMNKKQDIHERGPTVNIGQQPSTTKKEKKVWPIVSAFLQNQHHKKTGMLWQVESVLKAGLGCLGRVGAIL